MSATSAKLFRSKIVLFTACFRHSSVACILCEKKRVNVQALLQKRNRLKHPLTTARPMINFLYQRKPLPVVTDHTARRDGGFVTEMCQNMYMKEYSQ